MVCPTRCRSARIKPWGSVTIAYGHLTGEERCNTELSGELGLQFVPLPGILAGARPRCLARADATVTAWGARLAR